MINLMKPALLLIAGATLLLASCSSPASPTLVLTSTYTPEPQAMETYTPQPTPTTTSTLLPTATTTSTLEPSPTPDNRLGGSQVSAYFFEYGNPSKADFIRTVPDYIEPYLKPISKDDWQRRMTLTYSDGTPVEWGTKIQFKTNDILFHGLPAYVVGVVTDPDNPNYSHAIFAFPSQNGTNYFISLIENNDPISGRNLITLKSGQVPKSWSENVTNVFSADANDDALFNPKVGSVMTTSDTSIDKSIQDGTLKGQVIVVFEADTSIVTALETGNPITLLQDNSYAIPKFIITP